MSINTFVDLFCGIGGFHYAASDLGLECAFASEIDKYAIRQYEHNFGMTPSGDITKIPSSEIPDHDILFAGFPCQSFSMIGNMKGFKDQRGKLIYEVIRILETKKPYAFVLENVKTLVGHDGGRTIMTILQGLELVGYSTRYKVLNALDYGVPQDRKRVIFVGFRDDSYLYFDWPKPEKERAKAVDVLEVDVPGKYYINEKRRNKNMNRYLAKYHHKPKQRPMFWLVDNRRLCVKRYSYTLVNQGGDQDILIDGERKLTSRERLRLQGFPDSYEQVCSYAQVKKQTGNAAPVPLVKAVINQVLKAYRKETRILLM